MFVGGSPQKNTKIALRRREGERRVREHTGNIITSFRSTTSDDSDEAAHYHDGTEDVEGGTSQLRGTASALGEHSDEATQTLVREEDKQWSTVDPLRPHELMETTTEEDVDERSRFWIELGGLASQLHG